VELRGTGIWSHHLRFDEPAAAVEEVRELEALGYSAAWIPDVGGDLLDALDRLLAATSAITIATGVLNVWMHPAADVAAWWHALAPGSRDRVLLGLGVSHAALIGDTWARPLAVMRAYLDELDAAGLPARARCLAALGPKMLAVARDRSAGAHPYNVTVAHTAAARADLGPGALLAPEVAAVLEPDAGRARAIARQALAGYTQLPNYANNWRRLGYRDDEISSLADRLVDDLVAWGDLDAIAARVAEHRAAGADHVALQVLTDTPEAPRDQWRTLAPAVAGLL
jgi:probable F420-dependent oxidoreductase